MKANETGNTLTGFAGEPEQCVSLPAMEGGQRMKHKRETVMKRRAPAIGREALTAEVASLSKMGTDELRERWKAMFGRRRRAISAGLS